MTDKIPLTLPYKHSLLLPRLRTVLDIMGWPTDASGMVRMAKENPWPELDPDKVTERPLPADPKTLKKALVTPRIAKRVYRYLRQVVGLPSLQLPRMRNQFREDYSNPEGKTTWNEMAWRSVIRGWQIGPYANCDWLLQYPKTVEYMLGLCDTEQGVTTKVYGIKDDMEKAAIVLPASKDAMLVDEDVLDELFLVLLPRMIEQDKSVVLTEDEARALLWFGLDGLFRFSAVAEREFIDNCGTRYDMDKDESKRVEQHGILESLLPIMSDENLVLPYKRLFEGWRDSASIFKERESPMSWQTFANLFPDPVWSNAKPGEVDVPASKKRQLLAWRQGRRPRDETIEAFIRNLYGQQSDVTWHIAWKNMAYGLSDHCDEILHDRLFQHLDIKTLLVETCARYGDYFRWAKARATREESPAEA